jgi:RNA polymerase sigma-70 factor, ECF subfamily
MVDSFQPLPDPSARVDEFMKLYAQHQRRLYIYLLSLVHNATDAEDVLQETNYILWKKFDEFQAGSSFGAWACRIGYLEVLKFRAERKQMGVSLGPEFLEHIKDRMAEFSELLEDRTDAFNHCMRELAESDRRLITLRYTPGASVTLIATELDRPVRSVSKSLVRIRKTLLKCIDRRLRQEEHR